jgi:general secretion pathway protein J
MLKLDQRGFTLLELLIGLSLLGLMLVLLFGGLRLGFRSWDAGEERFESSSQLGVVQSFLRRQLSQIYPLRWKAAAERPVAFLGESHAVRFAGQISSQFGLAGVHLIVLEQERGEEGEELIMRWRRPNREMQDFSAVQEGEKAVLVKHVKEVAFAYYGAENEQTEPVWQEEWKFDQRLPSLIRLRVTRDDDQPWPDIVVAPMVSTEAACVWDEFFKRCVDQPQ